MSNYDALKVPYKLFPTRSGGNILRSLMNKGLDYDTASAIGGVLDEMLRAQNEYERQNYLEIERWADRNHGGGAIAFVTIASDGSGDFTSIKTAIEAQPGYGSSTDQDNALSLLYVKPGVYNDAGLGVVTPQKGSRVAVMGSMINDHQYDLQYEQSTQKWSCDGFGAPSSGATGRSVLFLNGLAVQGNNQRMFNPANFADSAWFRFSNCRIDVFSMIYGGFGSIQQPYVSFNNVICDSPLYGETITFCPGVMAYNSSFNLLATGTYTVGRTSSFQGQSPDLKLHNCRVNIGTNTVTFGASAAMTTDGSNGSFQMFGGELNLTANFTCTNLTIFTLEGTILTGGSRVLTLIRNAATSPIGTYRVQMTDLRTFGNDSPSIVLSGNATLSETLSTLITGVLYKLTTNQNNGLIDAVFNGGTASSQTLLTITGNDNLITAAFRNGTGSLNTAISNTGLRNRFYVAGTSGFAVPFQETFPTDGDYTDITVSAGGTVWTIDNGVVTPAKLSFDPATQAELDAEALTRFNDDATLAGLIAAKQDADATLDDLITLGLSPLTSRVIRVTIGGGGAVLTPGLQLVQVSLPYAGTITKARLLADQTGDVELDVFVDPYASYPPTTSIVASAPPTITGLTKSEDAVLTGWDKTFNAGDVLEVEVVSVTDITKLHLDLFVTVTG